MSAVRQLEALAQDTWEAHHLNNPASNAGKSVITLTAEKLIDMLIAYPSPHPQIMDGVFINRDKVTGINVPRVGIKFVGEAASRVVGGAVDHITYETHPEWKLVENAEAKRWLVVQGFCVDDQKGWADKGKRWGFEYIFENGAIKKQEKINDQEKDWTITNPDAPILQADLVIMRNTFSAVQDQIVPLLVKSIY